MRKFLLSSFALLMSVAMMAVGAGDGTNKANAIDFDWTSGNIHEAPGALWYCVDLAPVNAAAEPALVLYLTNLSDEEAAVDVQISLAGSQRTVSYNIAAEGYYRMDLPIAQFREFITVDQVNLALQSNQKIALSAKVYEFPEYVKEAVANSEPIDWNSGVKQDALSTKWYEVDITSLKTEKQHLQVGFINHEASKKALLTATFVLRGENITLPLVVPAGFSTTKVIDYQLLAKLPVNRIHVGVTTDSPIEVVTSTRSAIADDPTPCLNAINAEHGVTYVHEAGDTQWYKISLDLLKSTDAFSSFYLANKGNQRANVTIGMVPDCQYTTGTKITLPIPAGFELGALAPNILGNLIEELTRFESAYNKVDAKDVYLEIKTDQPIHFGLDVTNAATNPCLREDLVTFDWATGAKIEAGKATWFDMELDAVRNLGSHINFTFTNHADSLVWVATVVSVDCPAKVTMPLLVPVPARASVDQLVDYSILDAINIDNIYVGVKADGPVELKATAVNAEVIPSAGCENATVLGSGEYTQNPGTKWYQLPMSLFDEVGAAAKLSFKNLTGSTATLSAGVTVGCEYAIAHRAKVKVPKSIDLSVNVPKRILNFARQFVDNDVENFYLQLTTDKAIKFSLDLQAPDVDACRDAVEFDWAAWEKDGLQLEANQDKWYKVNLDYLFNKLENGEDLVVNLVNGSEDMDVHVLASVSPTCPALLSIEKTVDIPAGSDLYKVFTYEEVMKYVGQYDKYIYDGELEMLLGQLATYKVYNKMVELLERTPFAKFIPFGQVDLLLEAYGDHLTIAGIKDIVNNYEKYLSVAQLKEVLKTQKEYVSLQDAITLIEKYGDYIPYVDAEKILNNYEKYLPAAGGVASILKKCEKYITHENLQKVVDRCKQYLPIEEMKVLINRLKQYLPENNSCYVNIKTTGELIVKPDDPEPPTPEEPCCPEECEDVEVLDWKMVKLSNVELNKLYKLDITGLYSQPIINFFVTNDVHSDTVVIASEIYAHCQDATPVAQHSNKVKTGMSIAKVAHDKFAELVDSAQCCMFVKFTAFDTIPVTPDTDPCANIPELDWRAGVKLSELQAGWYKLYVGDVHANQESVTAKVINDLTCKATVTAYSYAHCESDEALSSDVAKTFKLGESVKTVSYADFSDVVAPHLEYVYVNVISIVEDCEPIEPGEDCEHAILLDWSDVKLSQLVEGNWYKLDFSEVHANKLNPTFKATNDLNGDASVSAVAYYHCEDTEAMGEATKKLAQGHVGEREVSYKELTDMIGQAEVLYVQVTDITIVDPCADIPEIDWTKGIKLSQLQEGAMYKLNVASVHEGKADVMVSVENDLTCKTRVAASAYYDCQDDETFFEGSYAFELGAKEYVVKYDEFQDYVAEYIEYVYVRVDTIKCAEKDTVDVAEFVCDGTEYVDALGDKHIISSLLDPALLTWTAETTDTVYNYVITPIVAPAEMTAELLATIPGAMPVLVAGEKVDVTGTVEAIKNYYDSQDTEAVADVETVVWTAGADATLACEAKSHTMLLTVTSGCEFEWTVELTLDVTPVDVVETTETATICEGETYEWDGKQLSETGSYPMEITNAAGCVVEIKTLELTVTPAETVTLAAVEACDSYEWHGVTYTESGEYTYTENCKTEVLPLTIVKSETVILDPVVACESYEWHGVTYTESGEYTYTDNCMTEVLKLTINTFVTEEITVTECHAYTWRGETYTVSGDYTYEGDCYKEILHLTIEGQIPENNPELAEAEAVAKYGNRLVMLHLNNFVEKYGWTPAAGDVAWYQVNGDVDTSWEVENDTPLGTGYYIDSQEGYTGEVYAVINASTEDKCQNIYRTKVIALVPAGQAPKLMPTIARPSEDLHLMNLNPSNVTEVRVFNTSGELMATYQAEEASEFVFKAATLPGYYMVEVQHNGEQTTLRYIVK